MQLFHYAPQKREKHRRAKTTLVQKRDQKIAENPLNKQIDCPPSILLDLMIRQPKEESEKTFRETSRKLEGKFPMEP